MPQKTSLLRVVRPGIIRDAAEYWSIQVASVILCMDDHALLQHRPENYLGADCLWSIEGFRGAAPARALADMQTLVQNWGTQYVLVEVLNRDVLGARTTLLGEIEKIHGPVPGSHFVRTVVSGNDSTCGRTFLTESQARIGADMRRRVRTSREMIKDTDIALILDAGERGEIALFGEVEGNHGEKLLNTSWWATKSDLAQFGIGILHGGDQPLLIGDVDAAAGKRVVMLFGTQNNVIVDFHVAVDVMERILRDGPSEHFRRALQPGLQEAVSIVYLRWRDPARDLVRSLLGDSGHIDAAGVVVERPDAPDRLTTPDPL